MPARKNTKSTEKMERLMNSIAEDDELDVLQVAGCIEALVHRMYDLGELRGRATQFRIAKEQEVSSAAA